KRVITITNDNHILLNSIRIDMFILKRFFGMRDEKKIHKQEEIRLILVAVRVAVPPFRNPLTLEVTVYFRHFSTQNNEGQCELCGSPESALFSIKQRNSAHWQPV
ncbi:hypothetical protein R2460_004510, partial [Escherichia coli]|nr:hypothetical protein [Escherichia coli]